MMQEPIIEIAALADTCLLKELIERSVRALCVPAYTPEQIENALGSVWGLDTQLIEDQTYFVARAGPSVVACGGWSWRETLFGADAHGGRSPGELQPGRDAARIRAFFVCPRWVRRGLGRRILLRCEHEASRRGFASAQLMATLPGVKLYRSCGYAPLLKQSFLLPGGGSIDFVPMIKQLSVHQGA
jgi:GNAT superfamily N-acetyltransferase